MQDEVFVGCYDPYVLACLLACLAEKSLGVSVMGGGLSK
jgi:hypothetical protein